MSRPLSHRIEHGPREGQCRDCGGYDANTARLTCCRCALERMEDRGYAVVRDPVGRFDAGAEMWRQPAAAIRSGAVQSDRFYLYVGMNDGGSLALPMGDDSAQLWHTADARTAQDTALALAGRYTQVWVVTTVGCWNAIRPDEEGARP